MSTDQSTDAWMRRIDALLAKAASTEFPEEAEALLAKAQSLRIGTTVPPAARAS
jgi:hypothetical protein